MLEFFTHDGATPMTPLWQPLGWKAAAGRPGRLCSVTTDRDTRGAILHSHLQLSAAQLSMEQSTWAATAASDCGSG